MPDEQVRPRPLARQAARGAVWAAAETWGLQLAQFGLFLILARLLGPEAYGLVGIALTVNIVGEALISEGGWIEAIVQRRDLDIRHLDAAFWALLALGIGLSVVACCSAPLLAALFDQPRITVLTALLSLALPLRCLAVVPEALLCRHLDFAPLAVRSLLSVAIAGIGGVTLAVNGVGVWSLLAYYLLQPLTAGLLVWHSVDYRPAMAISRPHLRSLLPFVGTMLVDRAVVTTDSLLPRLVIGYLLGPGPLGHYTIARKVIELAAQLLTKPIMKAGLSGFASSAGEPEELRRLFGWAVILGMAVACPGFLGLALVAPEIVALALDAEWKPAIGIIQILALCGPALVTARLCAVLLYGLGRPGTQLAANCGGLLLLLALLAVGTPLSGAVVAALIVARTYLALPWHLVLVRRVTEINPMRPLLKTGPTLGAVAVMVMAVVAFRWTFSPQLGTLPLLVGSMGVGALGYGLALALLARPLLAEISALSGWARLFPERVQSDASETQAATGRPSTLARHVHGRPINRSKVSRPSIIARPWW
jgi:O-antigen/teichoic acid export membrane protein